MVAKGTNKTLDVTGKGLADGNYVPVTANAARVLNAFQLGNNGLAVGVSSGLDNDVAFRPGTTALSERHNRASGNIGSIANRNALSDITIGVGRRGSSVEGLTLEVGTDLNESATSGKFAEVDFETNMICSVRN